MMGPLFNLALRQIVTRRRLALVLGLAALPVVLTWVISGLNPGGEPDAFLRAVLDALVVAVVLPVVTIAVATAAFGNEMEDRTLGFLVLKPVSRWEIVAAKAAASMVVAGPPVVISGVLVALIGLDGDWRGAVAAGAGLLAGVVAYSTVFTWLGLVTSRALGFGLAYVLLWEGALASFFSGVRLLSIRGYTLGIMHAVDPATFRVLEGTATQMPAAVIGAVAASAAFLLLTVHRLRTMDVR